MGKSAKSEQLQIRVSSAQKTAIQRAAVRAGLDMSAYVLSRERFDALVAACADTSSGRYALAELNSFLSGLNAADFRDAVALAPTAPLTPFIANYVAAMVEYGCSRLAVPTPSWTRGVEPLAEPAFATTLQSLRLHLLTHSPAPFRRRNIFIDTTLGARV